MFCPKCGVNVNDNFKFCFNCGFDLSVLQRTVEINTEQIVDNKIECKEFDNLPSEIKIFDGSQNEYERLYYKYIYSETDFVKAVYLENFVAENYSDKTYRLDHYLGIRANWMQRAKSIEDQGFENTLISLVNNQGDAQQLSDYVTVIGHLTSIMYFYNVIGKRWYESQKFFYDWVNDIDRYNKLHDRLNNVSTSNAKKIIENRIKNIENKYGGHIETEYMVHQYVDLMDLERTQADISMYAAKYSSWIDEAYTVFLNNAIKIHKLDSLNNMYPTTEQKNKFRKIIEDKFLEKIRFIYSKLGLLVRKGDECIRLADNVMELSKKTSGEEILKKGALSLGLAIVSGPIAVLNGIREGYNYFEADSKLQELRIKLWDLHISLFNEGHNLIQDFVTACNDIDSIMQEDLAMNYLYPALNNVVETIKNNNMELYPWSEYFKK
ncbi:zinc ribbon domain-containing protein [uncultured Phascolarctobacterium sp.]|uniref:zinc ribbon domain-containing protein n=1 Tax=uncultured Phascolarctobacterium sp. TaxID=512296 RepID=UPI0025EFD9BD|nr:zinc ribbon domain-containing protein [uncultured Phascolarctobacterium sp.]